MFRFPTLYVLIHNKFDKSIYNIFFHCVKMSIVKLSEKLNNPLDVAKISNQVNQLYLEDMSQDCLNEIIKEMYNLYNEENSKRRSLNLIFDALEKFLVEKKQNPDNIIKYCLDNQFDSMIQIILAICYHYGKW